MARVREKQQQKRKEETVDVAMRMLTERGYANFSMDDLAEEVGISKPTIYQYFNSKEELLAQVMVRMFEKMEAQILPASDDSPLDQIEGALRRMLTVRFEGRNMMGLVDKDVMRSVMHNNPAVIERLSVAWARLGELVRLAQEKGEIDPELPSWVVVNMIMSLPRAIHNPFFDRAEAQHSDEELRAAIETLIRMFRRSVSASIPEKSAI